jgi:uncharacterized membrane protein HdeD (DUF308 family)/uncharacterized membrane protein YjdF
MSSPRTWDWPRIIYGDWTWFIRDWLDVIRVVFIGGTIVFAVQGRSDVMALTAASIVLIAARIINLPRWFDFGLTAAMTLIAWGTALSLYGQWFYYDKVVHSLSPFAYTPVLYIALVRLGVVPDPGTAIRERRIPRIAGIFIVAFAVGLSVGAFYENIEWIEDKFDILGGHFVKGLWDTETDLLCDTAGSLAGATFLTVWALKGWSSRRTTVHAVAPPATTPIERARARQMPSWRQRLDAALSPAVKGVLGIAVGAVLLAWPSPALRTVGVVAGVGLLAHAALEVSDRLRHRDGGRSWRLAEIVAEIGVGGLLLGWPGISKVALLYAIGLTAVLLAALEAASLEGAHTTRERWLGGVAAAVAFIFGIAMLGAAERGVDTVVTLVGAYFVALGVVQLVRAVWRPVREARASVSAPDVTPGTPPAPGMRS